MPDNKLTSQHASNTDNDITEKSFHPIVQKKVPFVIKVLQYLTGCIVPDVDPKIPTNIAELRTEINAMIKDTREPVLRIHNCHIEGRTFTEKGQPEICDGFTLHLHMMYGNAELPLTLLLESENAGGKAAMFNYNPKTSRAMMMMGHSASWGSFSNALAETSIGFAMEDKDFCLLVCELFDAISYLFDESEVVERLLIERWGQFFLDIEEQHKAAQENPEAMLPDDVVLQSADSQDTPEDRARALEAFATMDAHSTIPQ